MRRSWAINTGARAQRGNCLRRGRSLPLLAWHPNRAWHLSPHPEPRAGKARAFQEQISTPVPKHSARTALQDYLRDASKRADPKRASPAHAGKVIKRLERRCEETPEVLVTDALMNGVPGDPLPASTCSTIAERSGSSRSGVAAEEINYRRFFDVNDLAAIRMELPEVLMYASASARAHGSAV